MAFGLHEAYNYTGDRDTSLSWKKKSISNVIAMAWFCFVHIKQNSCHLCNSVQVSGPAFLREELGLWKHWADITKSKPLLLLSPGDLSSLLSAVTQQGALAWCWPQAICTFQDYAPSSFLYPSLSISLGALTDLICVPYWSSRPSIIKPCCFSLLSSTNHSYYANLRLCKSHPYPWTGNIII